MQNSFLMGEPDSEIFLPVPKSCNELVISSLDIISRFMIDGRPTRLSGLKALLEINAELAYANEMKKHETIHPEIPSLSLTPPLLDSILYICKVKEDKQSSFRYTN